MPGVENRLPAKRKTIRLEQTSTTWVALAGRAYYRSFPGLKPWAVLFTPFGGKDGSEAYRANLLFTGPKWYATR